MGNLIYEKLYIYEKDVLKKFNLKKILTEIATILFQAIEKFCFNKNVKINADILT